MRFMTWSLLADLASFLGQACLIGGISCFIFTIPFLAVCHSAHEIKLAAFSAVLAAFGGGCLAVARRLQDKAERISLLRR